MASAEPPVSADRPTVVLLHGLGRTGRSMARLQRRIEAAGHPTWRHTYPSRQRPLAELAASVRDALRAELGDRPLSAVTHSMGGIIARFLSEHVAFERIVMLAPPNHGSRVARGLQDWALFRRGWGPAGKDMAAPRDWPPVPPSVGVIAGTAGPTAGNPPSWLFAALGLLRGLEHDGTVAVDEARVDHVPFATVPASHTWIMDHPETVRLTLRFLETGGFE